MTTDVLGALLADLDQQPPPTVTDGPLPASPSGRRGKRKLESHDRTTITIETVSLSEGRQEMEDRAMAYLELDRPVHFQLHKPKAGTGKTHLAVKLAIHTATVLRRRVLFIAPRHNFWDDVMAEVDKLGGDRAQWFHWLPRQRGDEEQGIEETCRYEPYMATWLHRGHEAMNFCERACRYDYINNICPYHAQKKQAEHIPIIFAQHQHLTAGHPLMGKAQLILGDESPLGAFPDNWNIPAKWIVPEGMPYDEPLTELLYKLQAVATQTDNDPKKVIEGRDLLDRLGGPAIVREACEMLSLPDTYEQVVPNLWHPTDADNAPFWHLPDLTHLLIRECKAADTGKDYVTRVRLAHGKLHLLRRSVINESAPPHIIWFDATANEHLYQTVFQRPIEVVEPPIALQGNIYQVHDSLNNRSKLIKVDGSLDAGKVAQLKMQIQTLITKHGYQRPVIISHMPLEAEFAELGDTGHFGGERGTNRYEGCDVAFIVGAQQPSTTELVTTAAMIYHERMTPFRAEWQEKDVPFVNHPHSYLVSGFYADDDLQALLWQSREAELIQAAHRVRPVRRPVDIWLMTNIPVRELPPTKLVTIADIFDAPAGIDPYKWHDLLDIAEVSLESGEALTSADLAVLLDISPPTARKYLEALAAAQPGCWVDALVPNPKGRPWKGIKPLS